MKYANPFAGEIWYSLTNVAVKTKTNSPYDKGNGDMVLKSPKVVIGDPEIRIKDFIAHFIR